MKELRANIIGYTLSYRKEVPRSVSHDSTIPVRETIMPVKQNTKSLRDKTFSNFVPLIALRSSLGILLTRILAIAARSMVVSSPVNKLKRFPLC